MILISFAFHVINLRQIKLIYATQLNVDSLESIRDENSFVVFLFVDILFCFRIYIFLLYITKRPGVGQVVGAIWKPKRDRTERQVFFDSRRGRSTDSPCDWRECVTTASRPASFISAYLCLSLCLCLRISRWHFGPLCDPVARRRLADANEFFLNALTEI